MVFKVADEPEGYGFERYVNLMPVSLREGEGDVSLFGRRS